MPIEFKNVEIFNVESGEGKNGLWCNVSLLHLESRSQVTLNTRNLKVIEILKENIGKNANITAKFSQNKFGERVTDLSAVVILK